MTAFNIIQSRGESTTLIGEQASGDLPSLR